MVVSSTAGFPHVLLTIGSLNTAQETKGQEQAEAKVETPKTLSFGEVYGARQYSTKAHHNTFSVQRRWSYSPGVSLARGFPRLVSSLRKYVSTAFRYWTKYIPVVISFWSFSFNTFLCAQSLAPRDRGVEGDKCLCNVPCRSMTILAISRDDSDMVVFVMYDDDVASRTRKVTRAGHRSLEHWIGVATIM
jgi:hypothetical protein